MARDPYTAAPVQVLQEDPGQGGLLTNTQYAYTQSAYSAMGPLGLNSSNANSLLNVSQTTTIKYPMVYNAYGTKSADLSNSGFLLGGSKTSFSNSIPYRTYSAPYFTNTNQTQPFWKPSQSYQLLVDANTPGTQTSLNWRQSSMATSFNASNQGIQEAQGLNGRYASAVKLGYKNQYKVAEATDASLNCFAFSSFEDGTVNPSNSSQMMYGGEITHGTNSVPLPTPFFNNKVAVNAHSGTNVVQVTKNGGGYGPGFITKNFDVGRTYQASVWVHTSSPANCSINASLDGTINGSPNYIFVSKAKNDPSNITVGNWILMSVQITVPTAYVAANGTASQNDLRFFMMNTNSASAYFDDLSVHPVDSPIKGYVYNPSTGWLLSVLDNDNFATSYDYDQAGRIINVYQETKNGVKKISSTSYNFGRP